MYQRHHDLYTHYTNTLAYASLPITSSSPRPHSVPFCSRNAHDAPTPFSKRAETPQETLQRALAHWHLPYAVVHTPEVRRQRGGRGPEEQEGGIARVGGEFVGDCA